MATQDSQPSKQGPNSPSNLASDLASAQAPDSQGRQLALFKMPELEIIRNRPTTGMANVLLAVTPPEIDQMFNKAGLHPGDQALVVEALLERVGRCKATGRRAIATFTHTTTKLLTD